MIEQIYKEESTVLTNLRNRLLSLISVFFLLTGIPAMAESIELDVIDEPPEEIVIYLGEDDASAEEKDLLDEGNTGTMETEDDISIVDANEDLDDIAIEADVEEAAYAQSANPAVLFYWNETVTYSVTQKFNLKSGPYANSANVGSVAKGSSLTFTRLVVNGYNNLWGMTRSNQYAYLGLKIKNGSWSTDGTQYFKKVQKPAASQFKFSDIAYPSSYTINPNGYYLSNGSISSIYPFKTLKTEIKSGSGKVISSYTRNISGTVYAVKNLDTMSVSDNGVKFSWIKDPGTYYWNLTATDLTGYSRTYSMKFTAKNNTSTSTEIVPTSVSLNTSSFKLQVGQTYKLTATVYPANAANKTVTWYTDNTNVATVSGGVVTAKGIGTATIMARTVNTKIATATVTVSAGVVEPVSIAVNSSKISMYEGGWLQLNPTVYPTNATNKTITYKSSKTSVARVDASGKVTAIKKGSCTITASTFNKKSVSVYVTVLETPKPSKVTLNRTGTVSLNLNNRLQLYAQVSPIGVTSVLTWTTSNKKIATVDPYGVVTAVGAGKATITVKTQNGKKATVKVEVVDPEIAKEVHIDLADKIVNGLSELAGNGLRVGHTMTIYAYCVPSTAKIVKYWSSNTKVAVVDSKGTITALKKGTAKIYAASKNGKKDYIKIKVIN